MTQSSLLLGYEPRCSVYPRKSGKRKVYYLSYYLPNGKRILRFAMRRNFLQPNLGILRRKNFCKESSMRWILKNLEITVQDPLTKSVWVRLKRLEFI